MYKGIRDIDEGIQLRHDVAAHTNGVLDWNWIELWADDGESIVIGEGETEAEAKTDARTVLDKAIKSLDLLDLD